MGNSQYGLLRHQDNDAMTSAELRYALAELELTRRRRELLFWSITMAFALIVLVAMSVAFLVSVVQGVALNLAQVAVGAAITGAGGGGPIVSLLRRFGDREPSGEELLL